jgi:phosphoribosyl-ATP pyrophosphohydrolase/phosphoribosyl-AMP cyclohydrolase
MNQPIAFGPDGLVPVIILDDASGDVLTLAYANAEALERTRATKSTWLYSRSRKALWKKGETSGHTQQVVSIATDCDSDAVIYRVIPNGPACHTGARSCFSTPVALDAHATPPLRFPVAMERLAATIHARRDANPETSYTAKLLAGGVDRIGKKIGEEATEVVIAAKNDDVSELVWETSDLLYHLLVMMESRGVSLDTVGAELARRASAAG